MGQSDNQVYRSANGSDWELITFEAWSAARHNSLSDPVTVFNGRLLASTGLTTTTLTMGCQLWSYLTDAAYLPLLTLRN